MNHAHTSQVGAASQTPTTPHIWTSVSRSNVYAATPYPSSLPHPTIPKTTLSHPVTYEQSVRGELPTSTTHHIRRTHSHPLKRSNHGLRYTLPTVSQDSSPNAPYFRLLPPSSHTRLTGFTTNGPYLPPTRISNFTVSSETSRDSSRRQRRSTVRTRPSAFVISRSYDIVSMPSESPRPPQSVAFTSFSRERPGRSTNHSRPEKLFPQHAVANSCGPT